jgi:hypothetical protein
MLLTPHSESLLPKVGFSSMIQVAAIIFVIKTLSCLKKCSPSRSRKPLNEGKNGFLVIEEFFSTFDE